MLPGFSSVLAGQSSVRSLTYLDIQTDDSETNPVTLPITFGAVAGDRVLVAVITAGGMASGTIDSVTIGGVSAPVRVQAASGQVAVGIASAVVPTGTSGDVAVTFSESPEEMSVALWSITGADSAIPRDTDSRTTAGALTLDCLDGGAVIGGNTNLSNRTTTWADATEQYDAGVTPYRYSGASAETAGTSVTVTPTLSGGATNLAFVAATF
jgi:hypothetical protein